MNKIKKTDHIVALVLMLIINVTIPTSEHLNTPKDKVDAYSSTILDLNVSDNCNSLHSSIGDFDIFWNSSYFISLLENVNPKDVEKELSKGLNDAAEKQIKFVKEYYDKMNAEIMRQYQSQKITIFNKIKENNANSFLELFKKIVNDQKCDEAELSNLTKYYKKIKEINELEFLANLIFSSKFDNHFYVNYFTFETKDNCVIQFLDELIHHYKNASSQYNELFKDSLDDVTKSFITKRGEPRRESEMDYLNFIDYSVAHKSQELNTYLLFIDDSYMPLSLFNFIFKNYKEEAFDIFEHIYEIIINFRIYARKQSIKISEETLVSEFKNYLDNNDLGVDDAYYFIIVVLMKNSYTNMGELEKTKKNIKPNIELIKQFVGLYDGLKPLIKDTANKNGIEIHINKIRDSLSGNKKYKQVMDDIIDGNENIEEEVIEDLEEFTKELKVSKKPKAVEQYKMTEASFYNTIFKYFVDRKDLDSNVILKHDTLLKRMAPIYKTYSLDGIRKILVAIDDEEKSFQVSFDNMLKFFKNPYAQQKVKEYDQFIKKDKDLKTFCAEIDQDFKVYGEIKFDMCSMLDPERPTFEDRFLENFVKLLTFIRTFKFYNDDNRLMVHYYTNIYKYIALNKYDFHIDNNINDMVLRFNDTLSKFTSRRGLSKGVRNLTKNIDTYHDLSRLLNIANLDLENAEVLQKVHMDTIFFKNLKTSFDFYEMVDREIFDPFLDFAYAHYYNNANYYHFNNIYMLLKAHKIVIINKPEKNIASEIDKVNSIVKTTNNINISNNERRLQKSINISRRAAFFFYLEYIRDKVSANETLLNGLEKILKDDVRELDLSNQIAFFYMYIVPKVKTVENNDNPLPGANKNFKNFIFNGIDVLKHKKMESSDLYLYVALNYFNILVEEKNSKSIVESGIISVFIERIFKLYQYNNVTTFQNHIERFGDVAQSLFTEESKLTTLNDLLLVCYYYSFEILNDYIVKRKNIKNPDDLYKSMNQDFDKRMVEYVQNLDKGKTGSRKVFGFNIDYLLFSGKLLFNKVFETKYTVVEPMGSNTDLNYLFGSLLLKVWKDGDDHYIKGGRLGSIQPALDKTNKLYSELFKLDENKIQKPLLNLNENIFAPSCLSHVFTLIMKNDDIGNDVDFLKAVVDKCLIITDKKDLMEIIVRLLKNVKYFTDSHKKSKDAVKEAKPMFEKIIAKATASFKTRDLIYILKAVAFGKIKKTHYHAGFSKFISAITQRYSLKTIDNKITAMTTALDIDKDTKNKIKNLLIKDLLIVYEDDGNFDPKYIDLSKLNLFSILTEDAKFAHFLTNMFAKIKIKDDSVVDSYLTLYLFINSFRVKKMKNYGITPDGERNEKLNYIEDFIKELDNVIKNTKNNSLRTRLYFLKMVNFMINQKNLKESNYEKTRCEIYHDLKKVSIDDTFPDNLNMNELKGYIINNKMAKNNFEYLHTKALENSKEFISNPDKSNCDDIEPEDYKNLLEKWIGFSKKVMGDKIETVNHFAQSNANKQADFKIKRILRSSNSMMII